MRIDRQDLYALLRARNIPYEETAHPAVWSMEELHALCLPGEERILKNLFLQDDKKRRYYLVAIDGGRTADLKALRRTLDSRPLRFADAADLERLLGLLPGQVTPLGALRAPAGTVTVVLDASLRGRTVGVHPLENTATTFLNLDDLAALLEDAVLTAGDAPAAQDPIALLSTCTNRGRTERLVAAGRLTDLAPS